MSRKRSHKNSSKKKGPSSSHHSKGPQGHSSRHKGGRSSGGQRKKGALSLDGKVQANEKGFGFFIPENGSEDAFIPPRLMNGILNGDLVKAAVIPDPYKIGKWLVDSLELVKHSQNTVVGTLLFEGTQIFLKPDDTRLPMALVQKGAIPPVEGQKAVLRVNEWPGEGRRLMAGTLEELLGFPGDPGVDIKSVIRKYEWPESFPAPVMNQVSRLPADPGPEDWEGRMDLRHIPILTIDGKDAKDFDDAISLEKLSNGRWRLGVHIADVSHYVTEDSPLDKEAVARSTSLYLADRVLPMLPQALSDGLCSLREGVPRLTVSAFLTYNPQGQLQGTEFRNTVIQSGRRGIYEEVQTVLDNNATPEIREKYLPFRDMLKDMVILSRAIRKERERKGSLDFDFPEVRAVIENGKVTGIQKKARLETHRLIEDFMVAANEAVATFLDEQKAPALYRIHEPPEKRDLEDLTAFLDAYHLPHKGWDMTTPPGMQKLIRSVLNGPWQAPVSSLALRSLKLAVYATRNSGHFGLGLDSYCHFTSPIRRYPDLIVHRALKKARHKQAHPPKAKGYEKLALHTSEQERKAEKAERESQKILQLRFMEGQIDKTFPGTIRHLTAHGAFVELEPLGVEGFLPMENLTDDLYTFDERTLSLNGKKGRKLLIGDKMTVTVFTVDMTLQRMTLTRNYERESSNTSKP